MTARILSLIVFLFSTPIFAADGPVVGKVVLNPFGNFDLVSGPVIGSGEKKGNVYTAKELKVSVNGLKTGMSLRDKHLKEKLESTKYPNIVVSDVKAEGGKGTAKMTVKDVTKPINFTFNDSGSGKATADFVVNLKDFKISGINYQGVGVEDEIKFKATIPYTGK